MNSPANIYWFKVNKRNMCERCEICSEVTIKTLIWCFYCQFWTYLNTLLSIVSIIDLEQVNVSRDILLYTGTWNKCKTNWLIIYLVLVVSYLYPRKTSESQSFFDVFRGYTKRLLAWNGLMNWKITKVS